MPSGDGQASQRDQIVYSWLMTMPAPAFTFDKQLTDRGHFAPVSKARTADACNFTSLTAA
jgi:hypothetical protein